MVRDDKPIKEFNEVNVKAVYLKGAAKVGALCARCFREVSQS